MNGIAHSRIMLGAINILPDNVKQNISCHSDLVAKVGNYPDLFDDPSQPLSDKIAIDPDWQTFCEFPDHMAAKSMHTWPTPATDALGRLPLIDYLLNKMVETYRCGDPVAFIKFSGCLSHLFGDTTQPAHLGQDHCCSFISQLLPVPDSDQFADFHYHTTVEAVSGQCEPLDEPALLGTSVLEAAWRIAQRCQDCVAHCRQFIVPIIQAIFAGDMAAAEAAATPPVTLAAQLTADTMLTAIKIAENSFSDHELAGLATVDLRILKPADAFHDLVYGGPVVDGNKDVPPNNAPVTPAALLDEDKNEFFLEGLGVLPHSGMSGDRDCWMKFSLPKGVFKTFSTTVGLHASLAKEGAVEFIIEQDGTATYCSNRMTAMDPAQNIELDISDTEELILRVIDANNGTSFWKNHAYWGKPELKK